MLAEILERGTELLTELETALIDSVRFAAVEDIPETMQDAEGYIAFLSNPAHTQDTTSPKEYPNICRFPGLLVGPKKGIGIAYKNRYYLLRYADAINQKFIERPKLQNSEMRPLPGVRECLFLGGEVIEEPYPRGSQQPARQQYSFTLQIRYDRFRLLSR